MSNGKTRIHLIAAVLLLATALSAHAALQRVGPVLSATDGYPAWYQDATGLTLEYCRPINQSELNGGWCLILPADVPNGAAPETAFTNYAEEHFYWNATAGSRTVNAVLVLSLEGAFGIGPPLAGDQIVFGRLRITIPSLPASGDYKVYTPFGDFDFPGLAAGDRLFHTVDIGIGCGTDFSCSLNSLIGPFLLPSATPGGPEDPPLTAANPAPDPNPAHFGGVTPPATPYPGTGKAYVSDPARIGPVTGSPLPPFTSPVDGLAYNHNRFRIELNGTTLLSDEVNFSTAGRIMAGAIPGRVTVNRASYTDQTTPTALRKLDVFATAFPTVQGRMPAGSVIPAVNPDLGFYDAPCTIDPATGAAIGPPGGPAGFLYYQMLNSGNNWWGQNSPAAIPPQVCVQDLNARNAAGQAVPAYFPADVTDEVDITVAGWDPTLNGGTLTIAAVSSDQVTAPALTAAGFGPIPAGGTLAISPLPAPPAKISVASTRGGTAQLDVRTGVGIPVSPTVPVANADRVTIFEDCSSVPAASCASPPSFNVLVNDTLNGLPIDPATATVAITAPPRLGSATLNLDKTIRYAPNPNANGTDIVGYTVTVNGFTSNEGYLTVVITPVNDIPVAANDTAGAPNNKPVTINVLANDTDVDGAADLASAVIASLPGPGASLTCNGGTPAAAGTVCSGGLVTFTPTATGTFTFTYRAQDQAGAQSVNAATVSVTVNATESIVINKSQYVVNKNRWVVSGTDGVPAGQTLKIAYTGGTYKVSGSCSGIAAGTVVGTAVVDPLGNWAFDAILTSAGVLNPSNTGGNSTGFWCTPPKQISVTSPLGGTATSNIILK